MIYFHEHDFVWILSNIVTDMTDKLESPSALNDLNFFLISTAALHSTFLGCALPE